MAVRDKIIEALVDAPDRTLVRKDLVALINARYDSPPTTNAIAQALHRMGKAGAVTRPGPGLYRLVEGVEG